MIHNPRPYVVLPHRGVRAISGGGTSLVISGGPNRLLPTTSTAIRVAIRAKTNILSVSDTTASAK